MARPALAEFVLCWDEVLKDYYVYHESTGEALYGAGADGDVTELDRSQASWRQPNEPITAVDGVVPFTRGDPSPWSRSAASLPVAEAAAYWEKHFDPDSNFYYFSEVESGRTQWTCPPGVTPNDLPCVNEAATLHSGSLQSVDWTSGWANTGEGEKGGGVALALPHLTGNLTNSDASAVRNSRERSLAQFPALPDDSSGGKVALRSASSAGSNTPTPSASGTPSSRRRRRHHTARAHRNDWDLSLKSRGGGGHFAEDIGGFIRLKSRQRHNDVVARLSRQRQRPQTTLPWASHRGHQQPPLRFLDAGTLLDGPYSRRTGQGKRAEHAVNRLKPQGNPRYKVEEGRRLGNRKVFIHPRDFNYQEWGLNQTVEFFDGHREGASTVEPMMLTRAAFEGGVDGIVSVMNENSHNVRAVVFGLIQLSKTDLPETAEGAVNPGAEKAMAWATRAMLQFKKDESVQAYALGLLAQLTDNYASRRALNQQHDWTGRTIMAMSHIRTYENEVTTVTEKGEETFKFTEPTRHAIDTCIHCCRLFAHMACDPKLREKAADDGVPMVVRAMSFCPDSALVHIYACKALFNFVYRCEQAHIVCEQEGVLELVESIPEKFPGDKEAIQMAERTAQVLRPGGWRGINE